MVHSKVLGGALPSVLTAMGLLVACSASEDDQSGTGHPSGGKSGSGGSLHTGGAPAGGFGGTSAGGSTASGGSSAFGGTAGASGSSGVGGASGSGVGGASGSGVGGASGSGVGGASGSGVGGSGVGGTGGDVGTGGSGGGPANIRFVAIGDVGKGNDGQKAVAAAIQTKCAQSGCDFVQLLGDNFYDNGVGSVSDPQWQSKFEEPYANVNLPFWVVVGNHDYGGNGTGNEPARAQVQVQYAASSQKWKLPSLYYKHSEPGVDFFGLDTNSAMFSGHAQQKTDIGAAIAQSNANWKIAFGHHPYLSNGPHGNAGSYENLPFIPIVNGAGVKDLMDTTICGKVDVYICGHDHSMQWLTGNCQGTHLLVSGAGASTTDLPGNNPTHFESVKTGFLYVEISGNSFKGTFIDSTGTVEFERTVTK